jgi:hypothetical protein
VAGGEAALEFGIEPVWCGIAGDPGGKAMRRSNVALRLQTSLLDEAKRIAESEGVALNQLINVAVAEKISALRTEEYFRERSGPADLVKAKLLLKKAGRGKPPVAGDEV